MAWTGPVSRTRYFLVLCHFWRPSCSYSSFCEEVWISTHTPTLFICVVSNRVTELRGAGLDFVALVVERSVDEVDLDLFAANLFLVECLSNARPLPYLMLIGGYLYGHYLLVNNLTVTSGRYFLLNRPAVPNLHLKVQPRDNTNLSWSEKGCNGRSCTCYDNKHESSLLSSWKRSRA